MQWDVIPSKFKIGQALLKASILMYLLKWSFIQDVQMERLKMESLIQMQLERKNFSFASSSVRILKLKKIRSQKLKLRSLLTLGGQVDAMLKFRIVEEEKMTYSQMRTEGLLEGFSAHLQEKVKDSMIFSKINTKPTEFKESNHHSR
jgi:hypothetical protein